MFCCEGDWRYYLIGVGEKTIHIRTAILTLHDSESIHKPVVVRCLLSYVGGMKKAELNQAQYRNQTMYSEKVLHFGLIT